MSGFYGSPARTLAVGSALFVAAALRALPAGATGVPIDGFLPMVGITLTDEFVDDIDFFPHASTSVGGDYLSANGQARFDVALLDTGAAVSLLTTAADAAFNLEGPYPGQDDGFEGTEFIQIGGATGLLEARVSDPLGLYAAGLQARTGGGAALSMNAGSLLGQTNTSVATLPVESPLPNILGLTFASQYATRIRNSMPQLFELDGKTVRSPAIDFLPLGTGASHGISRKAPMSLQGAAPSTPFYQLNLGGTGELDFYENPSSPTIVQGGHFLNVNASNNGTALNSQQFFFDTGASVTVLSELTALQLGIDVQSDSPDFTIEIIGSGGGSGAVPGFFIDQFTVLATGGSVTLSNVPVLVFDVTNPASPGNVVPGIVGTNVFAGRDIIIDPNPSLGGGGQSAGVYISDLMTTEINWTASNPSSLWTVGSNWSGDATPGTLDVVNLRNDTLTAMKTANLIGAATVWEVNISGAAGRNMAVDVQSGSQLTTFAGINVEQFGILQLGGGAVDAQYVEIMGGTLTGIGSIKTGSGPIDGQVENRGGVVEPGTGLSTGAISIQGRFANSHDGTVNIGLAGVSPAQFDRLLIDGTATLDGTLTVSLLELRSGFFSPVLGSVFTIIEADSIDGEFSTLSLPMLSTDRMWFVGYEETSVELKVTLPGDFDGDWNVDDDDLAVWKAGYGGNYSGGDFLGWQRYFGQSIGAVAAVPEPAAASLVAIGLVAIALRRAR